MILATAIITFVLSALDVQVTACDAPWFDRDKFEQILTAEMTGLDTDRRQGLVLTIEDCTDEAVTLSVQKNSEVSRRSVSIVNIAEEARQRTVAIAIGELAADLIAPSESGPMVSDTTVSPPPRGGDCPPPPEPKCPPPAEPKCPKCADCPAPQASVLDIEIGVFVRGFPFAGSSGTYAPELRVGVRYDRWRFDLSGYAMGWSANSPDSNTNGDVSTIDARAYLLAFSVIAGYELWRRGRNVEVIFDALAELGMVTAFASPKESSDDNPRINLLAGGHLGMTVGAGHVIRFRPMFTVTMGWIRGFNIYLTENFRGGFEGPAFSAGVAVRW